MLTSFLFLLLNFFSLYHGGHTAEYHFSQEEGHLNMNFFIDRHELTHYTLDKDCDMEAMLTFCTAKYLLGHSSVYINGENVPLAFSASRIEKEHLIILFEGDLSGAPIEEIKIKNDCFLAFESDFKNRIVVDIGRFRAAYQMNKGRKEIVLN